MKKKFHIILPLFAILSCTSPGKKNLSVTLSGTIANPVTNYIAISGIKEFGPGVIGSILVAEYGGCFIACINKFGRNKFIYYLC